MSSFADELKQFSKSKLKPTETRISYTSGRTFVKPSGSNIEKELIIKDNDQTTGNESNSVYWSRNLGYLVDLQPDLSIDEIIPRLYLSGDDVAENREILRANKITHILNLTSNISNLFDDEIKYMKLIIYDLPEQDILSLMDEAFEFIDEAINQNRSILVHCNAGIIIISYFYYRKVSWVISL